MIAIPNDTIDIPSIMNAAYPASTASAVSLNKLVDATQDFTTNGVFVGMIVQNHTEPVKAIVTAIDSATTISLSANIFEAIGESYSIYTDSTTNCVFYVGVSGDVAFVTSGGDTSIMTAASVGWHPVNIKKILSTGTTATNLLAGW